MKMLLTCVFLFVAVDVMYAQQPDNRYFELRTYYVHPGQLKALLDRFQNHTTALFEKHGMENIGYWLSTNKDHDILYYILAYPSPRARKDSWDAFGADPEWVALAKQEKLPYVDSARSLFMNASDIFPSIDFRHKGTDRSFEMRTYTCYPNRLPNLLVRFRDHTLKIFENHHMDNVAYFISSEREGVQPRLVYFLGHPSQEEAAKSWEAFRVDPEWIKAREASEKDGKIVEKVESVFLKPLPFSKIR